MDKKNTKHSLLKFIACTITILFFTSTTVYAENEAKSPSIKEILESGHKPQTDTPPSQIPVAATIQTPSPKEKSGPKDKYERSTPQGSFQGLSNALEQSDYELAINFMDMRNLPKVLAGNNKELARKLRIILNLFK